MTEPAILCISLSQLTRDARVLRQISVLREHGKVTTVGFGPAPDGVDEHIRVPEGLSTLPQTPKGVLKLGLRRLHSVELEAPAVAFARNALRGKRYDLVVANEARILALAFAVAGDAPVWGDMHEWAPGERDHDKRWKLLVAPLMDHLCREYLPRCAAVTTVSRGIAAEYDRVYGVHTELVRNARPFEELSPGPVAPGGQVRLVHSGGAEPSRNLTTIIDAARALPSTTLDLYLVVGGDRSYLQFLKDRAAGEPRIRFHDPVKPHELPRTLNAYDVGVHSIPPINFNMENALPNKVFDFLQARIAMVVSPNPEMAEFVRDHGLGEVAGGYDLPSLTAAITRLTPERIAAAKRAADENDRTLSSDTDVATSHRIVSRLLAE